MIQHAKQKQPADPVKQLVERFLCPITQDIMQDPVVAADGFTYERAGIMARRKAYEEAFGQTKELYDVISSYYGVEGQKRACKNRLANAQAHKNSAERLLANPRPEMQPVEVYKNKVVIMQVKQD